VYPWNFWEHEDPFGLDVWADDDEEPESEPADEDWTVEIPPPEDE
jgi:hypothetical protein